RPQPERAGHEPPLGVWVTFAVVGRFVKGHRNFPSERGRAGVFQLRPPSRGEDGLEIRPTTMPFAPRCTIGDHLMPGQKGKIGVLIEAHFDETEYRRFGDYFPTHGYAVEYLSHLWGQKSLTFDGNDMKARATVEVEVNDVSPSDYA